MNGIPIKQVSHVIFLGAVAETWRRVWGDGKFFADQDDFFLKNFHFTGKNL